MFAMRLGCIAALALAPWAHALLLQIPVDWQSSSSANVSWTNAPSDPPFTLELVNTDEFHDTFGIANNVNPSADFIQLTLPVIPQGTYTLRAINVTNQNQIYDETPSFTIQGPPASSHSSAASTSASASQSSTSVSSKSAASATLTVPPSSSTGGFGTTVANSNSANSVTSSNPSSTGSTAGTASSQTTPFNGALASFPNFAPWAIAALGVVAGAAAAL